MQTATSETQSKSLDLSICVHHYTLRAPCPKGQGNADRSEQTEAHQQTQIARPFMSASPLLQKNKSIERDMQETKIRGGHNTRVRTCPRGQSASTHPRTPRYPCILKRMSELGITRPAAPAASEPRCRGEVRRNMSRRVAAPSPPSATASALAVGDDASPAAAAPARATASRRRRVDTRDGAPAAAAVEVEPSSTNAADDVPAVAAAADTEPVAGDTDAPLSGVAAARRRRVRVAGVSGTSTAPFSAASLAALR